MNIELLGILWKDQLWFVGCWAPQIEFFRLQWSRGEGFHGGERVWMLLGHFTGRDGGNRVVFVSSSCCWQELRAEDGQDLSPHRPALVVTSDAFYENSSTNCSLILANQWELMSGMKEKNPSPVEGVTPQALRDFRQQWAGSTTSSQEKGVHETPKSWDVTVRPWCPLKAMPEVRISLLNVPLTVPPDLFLLSEFY